MENQNFSQIYTKLTKGLSPKIKDIFDRRFGVKAFPSVRKGHVVAIETLESIGNSLGITRERVRQIEEAGFSFIRKNHKETIDGLFAHLASYFKMHGGFKKEDIALEELGGKKQKPYVLFLLTMGNAFSRVCEKKDNHNFWVASETSEGQVKTTLQSLAADMNSHGQLIDKTALFDIVGPKYSIDEQTLNSYLEISKKIQQASDGRLGLAEWPEIKPRGVKDKAFLVFKKHQKPLHFREITKLIDQMDFNSENKKTHAQTVHNELIKDARFVLVGRGTYALSEWGYVPGTIKDVIARVLKEKQGASQEEVVKEVLNQRLVAKNTVMINLNNKKYFQKDAAGKYFIREIQTA